MNEERKATITKLAEAAFKADQRIRALSMMNTPQNTEKAKKAFIEYSLAEAEQIETTRALREAIGGYGNTPILCGR